MTGWPGSCARSRPPSRRCRWTSIPASRRLGRSSGGAETPSGATPPCPRFPRTRARCHPGECKKKTMSHLTWHNELRISFKNLLAANRPRALRLTGSGDDTKWPRRRHALRRPRCPAAAPRSVLASLRARRYSAFAVNRSLDPLSLGHFSPIFSPFFLVFCRSLRLAAKIPETGTKTPKNGPKRSRNGREKGV